MLERVCQGLKQHGSSAPIADGLLGPGAMNALMGFEEIWQQDFELGANPDDKPDTVEA